MKICVLVTTMHQNDLSIYKKMNLSTDAIIANQCDNNSILVENINGNRVKLISTDTRGASRNRNIALANAFQDDDIILFSDDDLVFNDYYEKIIVDEFEKNKEAEAIKFNLHDLSFERKITMKTINKFGKATRSNMGASGVWGLAIKKSIVDRHNLKFREDFGPGTGFYYKGEDTIFLQHLIKCKIKFYRSPIDIAGIDQSKSSWFKGYDEQFFIVSGSVLAACYPKLCKLIIFRSAYKSWKRKNSNFPLIKLIKLYLLGVKYYLGK